MQLLGVEPTGELGCGPDRSANSTVTCRRSPSLSAAGPAPATYRAGRVRQLGDRGDQLLAVAD